MRILIHDFAGHPFQVQLSRELARRGHDVTHSWFAGDIGPKGDLQRKPGDADTLEFLPLGRTINYSKANLIRRRQGDVAYGQEVARTIRATRPDIVLCGNSPTEVVSPLLPACKAAGAAFVYWVQDFNGLASRKLLSRRLPVIGDLVGRYYMWLDARHLRASQRVVVISDGFLGETDRMGIARDKIDVIPNWGAISDIPVLDKDTAWRREQGLKRPRIALYSGTLALKHNPELLRTLALALEERGDASVVAVAAGVGAEALAESQRNAPLQSLELRGLQPFERFPEVLGSADILLAVLEREAGSFSVPSKILSYLCAGRPIVLAAPAENLAARIVSDIGAGRVVEPEDAAGFTSAALHFLDDPEAAREAGERARAYAESHFRIDRVADRFEEVFAKARDGQASGRPGEAIG
ncbi:glycosyltransferase family 4 protein [Phaeovulum vinaykumarii]|uniref:UDP:flavonoid glycosyltransferase YjiC, YdhE family n=1 Tax=Phaeovulum vinaykumarii TaxID=407234 RepID=A0A1N7N3D8_9RHOB|nr:glycosyltransferase family 4 protein [Phaeovulum vinaykumarii]SIS92701.1 UDP:flavonoid glycosyltransferase YjiC, YdhE family [Phaeovulum vinaykumarii]SOC19127.1 UDP:flavonoid glycosyltransferase YjiC (YdhE family) [Phaeovulum vinaykumarii]